MRKLSQWLEERRRKKNRLYLLPEDLQEKFKKYETGELGEKFCNYFTCQEFCIVLTAIPHM
ncbi:MAG: hypothetical protein K2G50_03215, partial [Anaeroplasmataceae bacterium]|nr:hypothetical protein [Anaeroplasmataceae bacterium]